MPCSTGVVERRLAFVEVGQEQVVDRGALDGVGLQHLRGVELALGRERSQCGRRVRAEHSHLV
jgi:hypothetical protein